MSHVYVSLSHADGAVSIMLFVTKSRSLDREATPEAIEHDINKGHGFRDNPVVSWRIVDFSDFPADRTYRAAWADDGASIGYDMEKARAIHRDKLRDARAAEFAAEDAKFMAAVANDDRAALARWLSRNQELRDAPADPRIDAAQTIDELRAVTLPQGTAQQR